MDVENKTAIIIRAASAVCIMTAKRNRLHTIGRYLKMNGAAEAGTEIYG